MMPAILRPSAEAARPSAAWELTTVEMLETAITETGGDPAQAEGEFALHNRNGDEFVCTLKQILPNDASGSDTWFVSRDNVASAK